MRMMTLGLLAAATFTAVPVVAQPVPVRVEAPDPKGKPYLVAPGTHYWWLASDQGNVPSADLRLCSGEGEDASPEKLCGLPGVYLGRCQTGAVFGVRGTLMPRRTPAEMQIVTTDSLRRNAWLTCAQVADRAAAQKLAASFAGRSPPTDAPGLAEARAACANAVKARCQLAWYGFEPTGGPGSILANIAFNPDRTWRISVQSDAEVAKRDAEAIQRMPKRQ